MSVRTRESRRWAIVLAGGEGTRLSQFTLDRFGERRPKQYCAFLDDRTMLQHTWRRAGDLVREERIVTVIGSGHRRYLDAQQADACGLLIEQPRNRDTAPGLFLPLTYVIARDPEATVLVFPSDHFIRPDRLFASYMEDAARLAESQEGHLVLAAAVADRPETEYGWIQTGSRVPSQEGASVVLRFHEKPDPGQALQFFRKGFLWNTLNMAAKARALWSLGWRLAPGMMDRFEALKMAIGTPDELPVLKVIYETMEPLNLSRDILQQAAHRTLALPLNGLEWSDWGSAERIQATLGRGEGAPRPAPVFAAA